MIGNRLGHYEILESLGEGGMGQVWLARDPRLDRNVAVKVLPPEFAGDPERLARFEQEARASAALNHPHIAAIFDVGQETDDDGNPVHFMVQEALEGQPLREALERGPLPLPRALDLAGEIAEALAAAHGAGIVHRDLKPDNVFVTEGNHAKVLDFGLAKLVELSPASGPSSATRSPTMIGTMAGQVMGTAGYMAPEQVEGGTVDARTDLFAIGCVIYEMATGNQAFAGKSLIDTLHRIAHSDPGQLTEIDARLPRDLQRILDKCLAKDPARRYQHADDLVVDLADLRTAVEAGTAETAPRPMAGGSSPVTWAAAALGGLLLGAAGTWALLLPGGVEPRAGAAHVSIALPASAPLRGEFGQQIAISTDGTRLVYASGDGLHTRLLESREFRPLRGTEGGDQPFFSPDGEWVGYVAERSLYRVPWAGGAPLRVDGPEDVFLGAAWASDDTLVYTRGDDPGLWGAPADGGEPIRLWDAAGYQPDITRAVWPTLLPNDDKILFTAWAEPGGIEDDRIMVYTRSTGGVEELLMGAAGPAYVPGGWLVYQTNDQDLVVRPFDADGVAFLDGPPLALFPGSDLAVAANGTAAYDPRVSGAVQREAMLVRVDRAGREEPLAVEAAPYRGVKPSSDGSRALTVVHAAGSGFTGEIWEVSLVDQTRRRLTEAGAFTAIWGTDEQAIWFASGVGRLLEKPVRTDGTVQEHLPSGFYPTALHAAGLVGVGGSVADWDIVGWSPGDAEPHDLVATPATEQGPALSPDQTRLAYYSDTSGRDEVYLRDFPDSGNERVVSVQGGMEPLWSPDGSELYYLDPQMRMWAASIGPNGEVTAREGLFTLPGEYFFNWGNPRYAVAPDGSGFFFVKDTPAGGSPDAGRHEIRLILHWPAQLERLTSR